MRSGRPKFLRMYAVDELMLVVRSRWRNESIFSTQPQITKGTKPQCVFFYCKHIFFILLNGVLSDKRSRVRGCKQREWAV